MLQSKEISYIFTSTGSSKVIGGKNRVQTPEVQITIPLEVVVRPGDTLEVIGTLDAKLQPLKSERLTLTSRSIRLKKHQHTYGIPSIYDFLRILEEIPQVLRGALSGVMDPNQVSLLSGMVFGGVESLSKSVIEDMKATGLTHITSASGFNVSLITAFSLAVFTRVLNRRIAGIACLITIIAYSVMAGSTPPIIRASLMGVLYLFSVMSGRPYSVLRSLVIAIWVMLIYQPFLIYSISFLLTVTSTLGIVFSSTIFQVVKPGRGLLPELKGVLEENFKITLSVILFTTPILVSAFGSFSLVSPLSNALLLWMVPILTLGGMGIMALGLVSPLVGVVFSWPLAVLLEVFERSVHLLSQAPLANLPISPPSNLGIFLWYLCLISYLTWRVAVNSNKRQLLVEKK